eukprot:CAMPEP_0170166710 /NCGR_PEP_ID=MMETSP0040_2-20121228/322_1 /TAXON_ID=641309 /ORGANISM="Lotharella oceanica, Strain CCMP622" /LENGTH=268 /DNA_ID=CAMNT_0010404509 /DNA_START=23 /DNA_END=829 /DNA_ORIENTATION=+
MASSGVRQRAPRPFEMKHKDVTSSLKFTSRIEREAITALFVLSGGASREETKAMATLQMMKMCHTAVESLEKTRKMKRKRKIMLSPPPSQAVCVVPLAARTSDPLPETPPPPPAQKPQELENVRRSKRIRASRHSSDQKKPASVRVEREWITGFVTSHVGTWRMRAIGCSTVIIRLKEDYKQYNGKVVLGVVQWETLLGNSRRAALMAFGKPNEIELLCILGGRVPSTTHKVEISISKELREINSTFTEQQLKARLMTDALIARNTSI